MTEAELKPALRIDGNSDLSKLPIIIEVVGINPPDQGADQRVLARILDYFRVPELDAIYLTVLSRKEEKINRYKFCQNRGQRRIEFQVVGREDSTYESCDRFLKEGGL